MEIGTLVTLGQELHFEESLLAARLAAKCESRAELMGALTEALPQKSPATRLRIAEKLVQRLVPVSGGKVQATALARFIAGAKDEQGARDVVFYLTARADRIVGALAREVLYPALVERTSPRGLSAQQFRLMNTAALFDVDAVVTRQFVVEYAARRWNYRSRQSVVRALRIVRQAGLIDQVMISERPAADGFAIAPHTLSVPAFVMLLFEELPARSRAGFGLSHVQQCGLPRLFLLPPLQVSALLEKARAAGHLRRARAGARTTYALAHASGEAAVASILG